MKEIPAKLLKLSLKQAHKDKNRWILIRLAKLQVYPKRCYKSHKYASYALYSYKTLNRYKDKNIRLSYTVGCTIFSTFRRIFAALFLNVSLGPKNQICEVSEFSRQNWESAGTFSENGRQQILTFLFLIRI